jgi:hypothetical protein
MSRDQTGRLCAGERERETREDREVGVKLHLRQTAHPKRRKSVAGFQMGERPLDLAPAATHAIRSRPVRGSGLREPLVGRHYLRMVRLELKLAGGSRLSALLSHRR